MHRRTLLRSAAAGIAGLGGYASAREAGHEEETPANDEPENGRFSIATEAFENGGEIPRRFTCDGENLSPPLRIESPPEDTDSFALVVDDPDAPDPPFVHWLLWDVPAGASELPEDVPQGETVEALDGAKQGTNDAGDLGYVGPCPPAEDPRHTYLFSLYALDAPLDLDPGAGHEEVLDALFPNAIARAQYVGQYEREE